MRFDIPVTGVVEVAAAAAVNATKTGRIGIIGTPATIESNSYRRVIEAHRAGVSLFSAACPLFVPIVENGRTSPDDIIVKTLVSEYLADIKKADVDVLILGCTHYPLLKEAIASFLPSVTLIDPGAEAARLAASELKARGLDAETDRCGSVEFYVSDTVDRFLASAESFLRLPEDYTVKKIDIERF
jgi:glutamate racemase